MRGLAVLAALIAVLGVGCQPAPTASTNPATPPPTEAPSLDVASPVPTSGVSPTTNPEPSPAGTTTLRVYYLLGSFTDNAGLVPVLREVPKTRAVGAAAMEALLAGPIPAELGARPAMYTDIPAGTRFLGLRVAAGVATVNLSKDFEADGAAGSLVGRLAQVTLTLTQFASVSSVQFELDGVPVTTFGSERIVVSGPVTRATYADQLPAIFVDRPAWGGTLGNPARVVGLADVFEAQFNFRIIDAGGHALADGPIKATCGTGCLGTFDVTIPYTVTAVGWGTLQVYDLSAANGSIVNLTEYPVWLTP
jgi:germination protein M